MLSLYRQLTALRRAEPALNRGGIELVDVGVEDVLAYRRTAVGNDSFLVVLNLGDGSYTLDLAALGVAGAEVVVSTDSSRVALEGAALSLAADEGIILRL